MWEIKNSTPFLADRVIVIDKTGEKHWVVVVKGTFTITPGGSVDIAAEQVEPKAMPIYRGKDGESSLVYEQDLIAAKPRTDLYLNATAYAPQGRSATEVLVGLKTPLTAKTLVVRGDRRWERSALGPMKTSSAEPFVTMPITYERAHGGYDRRDPDPQKHRLDRRNPVGTGFFTSEAHRLGELLPNVEFPDGDTAHGPAGLGALCSYWEPRINHQGTYNAKWVETQKPLLPLDYDPQFLQCAPVDQQFDGFLRGGEAIGLLNMTPEGVLKFSLPKHYFAFTTAFGRRRLEHRARLDTVIIEPDHPRVLMVWRTSLPCHHDIDDIDFTRIQEKRYV